MLTTSVSPRDQQVIQDMPIADYLAKPLTQQQVERVLAQHFAG
jgi:two-component SAPR family response regulator